MGKFELYIYKVVIISQELFNKHVSVQQGKIHRIGYSGKNLKIKMFLPFYSQVGFAEFNNTADNRANIGGTIIGAPLVGQ